MLYVASNKIGDIYVASVKIGKAYKGSTLVYESGPSVVWTPNPVTSISIAAWQQYSGTLSTCTADAASLTIKLDVSNLTNSYYISGTMYWSVLVNGTQVDTIPMVGTGNNTWQTPSAKTISVTVGDTVAIAFDHSIQTVSNYGIHGTLRIR